MIIKAITSFKGLIDVPTLLVLFLLKIMMKLLKLIIKIPVILFNKVAALWRMFWKIKH